MFRVGGPHLVVRAIGGVDDNYVAVPGTAGPALDQCTGRDGIRPGVAFRGVFESNRDLRLRPAHDVVGDAQRFTVPATPAEVRVERVACAHSGDVPGRAGVNRQTGNRRVPHIVWWEQFALAGSRHGDHDGGDGARCLRSG